MYFSNKGKNYLQDCVLVWDIFVKMNLRADFKTTVQPYFPFKIDGKTLIVIVSRVFISNWLMSPLQQNLYKQF